MNTLLTQDDIHSAVWQKLKKHCEAELELLRRKNDNNSSAEETARLRGRIAQIKAFLALENPAPVPVASDD